MWGENGYIKLARELGPPEGQCGVAMVASYPTAKVIAEEDKNEVPVSGNVVGDSVTGPGTFLSISQCGDLASSAVKFDALKISPRHPSRGKALHVSGKGLVRTPFTESDFKMSVKMAGIPIFSHTGSMCGDTHIPLPLGLGHIDVKGFTCPAATGPANVGLDVNLPIIAPNANYQVHFTGTDGTRDLFCINVKLQLGQSEEKAAEEPIAIA